MTSERSLVLARQRFAEAQRLLADGHVSQAAGELLVAGEHAVDQLSDVHRIVRPGGNIHQARAEMARELFDRGILPNDLADLLRSLDNDRIGVQRHGNTSRFAGGGLAEAVSSIGGLIDAASGEEDASERLSVAEAIDQANLRVAEKAETEQARITEAARARELTIARGDRVRRTADAFAWRMEANGKPGLIAARVLNESGRQVAELRGWVVGNGIVPVPTGMAGGSRDEHRPLFLTDDGSLYLASAQPGSESQRDPGTDGYQVSLMRDATPLCEPYEGRFGTVNEPTVDLPIDEALVRGIGETLARLQVSWTTAAEARLHGAMSGSSARAGQRERLAPRFAPGDIPDLLRNLTPLLYGALPLTAALPNTNDAVALALTYALIMAPLFNYLLYSATDRGRGPFAIVFGALVLPGLCLGVNSGSSAAIYIAVIHSVGGGLLTIGAWGGAQLSRQHMSKPELYGESILMLVGVLGGVTGWLIFFIG